MSSRHICRVLKVRLHVHVRMYTNTFIVPLSDFSTATYAKIRCLGASASPTWTKARKKIVCIYGIIDFVGCQGVPGQKVQDCFRRTQIRERSWQLLAYPGFLGAGLHELMHESSVKFDWLATRSFRSSFGANTSKISIRKGGRLVWTLSKSPW